jgi:hypothetical protein
LRIEIESLAQKIEKAGDSESAIRQAIAEVEAACIDVVKISAERKFPLRLMNIKSSFSVDYGKLFGGALTALAAAGFGMPTLASVLSGIGAALGTGSVSIKSSGDLGLAENRLKGHPYRYISSFSKDLFNK